MAQKPKYFEQRVAIIGRGELPLDMLRYDSCSPLHEIDSRPPRGEEPRTVFLRRFTNNLNVGPSVGRWKSFGWHVVGWETVDDRFDSSDFSRRVGRAAEELRAAWKLEVFS